MKIAYYSHYVGKEFAQKAGMGSRNGGSPSLKTQGMARAMLKAGHEVTIYSPGITGYHNEVEAFEEIEHYPEGELHIKYPKVSTKHRRGPLNDYRLWKLLKKDAKLIRYDAFVYYNMGITSYRLVDLFDKMDVLRILEFEDNIFNITLENNKSISPLWYKKHRYNHVIGRTDAAFAVCKGMLVNGEVKHKLLTPGVINDEVIGSVTGEPHYLRKGEQVRLLTIGGGHYCKGPDLLVKALTYVKNPCKLIFYTDPHYFYSVASDALKDVPERHTVELRDLIPHDTLMNILNEEADVLLNATRSFGIAPQAAGFPSKMLEYAAMGRPIVSSEIGMLDDEFNKHITYYEKEDIKDIARCIDEVIENYENKDKAALELQKLAIKRYSINGTAESMKVFFKKISEDPEFSFLPKQ